MPLALQVSSTMQPERAAQEPSGYIAFCRRDPVACAPGVDEADSVPLTAENWAKLQSVNIAVNAAIKPMEDQIHYGRMDYWTIPTDGYGDCEDYALAKRKALRDAGFPGRALRLAVAQLASGEPHAVLTIATERGDFVLDNRTDLVLPWAESRVSWIARQDRDLADWSGFPSQNHPLLVASR